MKLASNYTLEVLKNTQQKYVFCVIRIEQREVKYYAEQDQSHFTHRWLQPEHWAAFDSKLYELLASNKFKNLSHTLNIDLIDFVHLKINKTKIPIDLLCGTITDLEIAPSDVVAAIECKIEYAKIKAHLDNVGNREENSNLENMEDHKKKQQTEQSSANLKEKIFLDNSCPQKVQPFKKIREKNNLNNKGNCVVDFLITSPAKHSKYKSKEKEEIPVIDNSIPDNSTKSDKFDKYRLKTRQQRMDVVDTSSSSFDESNKDNNFSKAIAVLSGTLNKQTLTNEDQQHQSNNPKRVRRSTSAPSNVFKEKNKTKTKTLITTKVVSHQSKIISKKKRSNRSPIECQENREMGEWFVKKSSQVTRNSVKNCKEMENISLFKSVNNELASCRELQLSSSQNSLQEKKDEHIKLAEARIHYNRKVTKLLQDLTPESPKKIKNLDLMDMSANDILKTFKHYQPQLEKLFQKFKSFPKMKRSNGVDHFLVMGLLRNTTQLVMMNELSEHYEKNGDGLPEYGELFSMVLMPEWILSIFMKRYDMTREEAINHIKAQNAYKSHMQSEMKTDDTLLA